MTDVMTTHEGQRSAETKLVCVVDDDPVQRRELADSLRYKGIRNLTLEARYARLFWSRGGNIGTGLDATGEPTRTELAAQIKWSF